MSAERCAECGFDGDQWTDHAALEEIGRLGTQWAEALAGSSPDELRHRPITDMWSIAEYTDHVREVLFAMRFALDSAVADPGIDLGAPPEPEFTPEPRSIDAGAALRGLATEASALSDRLRELPPSQWAATAFLDGSPIDAHWVCRHAVHDAHHHLGDVRRLRAALTGSGGVSGRNG